MPIIIHLPTVLRKNVAWGAKGVMFTTDITPSLYYLLGHRLILKNRVFGRPLFTTPQKEQADCFQDSYLLGSSYGAIYGMLGDNGRSLFMADPASREDYYFNLAEAPAASAT